MTRSIISVTRPRLEWILINFPAIFMYGKFLLNLQCVLVFSICSTFFFLFVCNLDFHFLCEKKEIREFSCRKRNVREVYSSILDVSFMLRSLSLSYDWLRKTHKLPKPISHQLNTSNDKLLNVDDNVHELQMGLLRIEPYMLL